jgi:hypothetical protein
MSLTLIQPWPAGPILQSGLPRPGRWPGTAWSACGVAAVTRVYELTGRVRTGEVRVASGGIARLSAMASREYLADARRAHAEGGMPTVDDPAGRG